MNRIVRYIVEGKTEQKFISEFTSNELLSGKVEVVNLWEKSLSPAKLIQLVKRNSQIICIIDTDIYENDLNKIKILTGNLESIKRHASKVLLIAQNKNFEDEMNRGLYPKDFYKVFDVKSKSEFKSKFLEETNVRAKLLINGFVITKIWQTNDFSNNKKIKTNNIMSIHIK